MERPKIVYIMKYFYLIFSYFSFFSFLEAQTQQIDYSIFYNFTYITDLTQKTFSQPEEYILFKYKNTSRFLNSNAHHNDSLHNVVVYDQLGDKANTQEGLNFFMDVWSKQKKKYVTDLRVLKNFKKKAAIITLYACLESKYMEVPMKLNWELSNETKIIAGLKCYKATTNYGGRTYLAWYSSSIPISDGPYIFNGLPGLIVKIVDSNSWYSFEIKSINLKPNKRYVDPDFLNEKTLQKLNREEYVAQSTAEKDNPKRSFGLPDPDGTGLARKKKRRKSRFDLVLEQ
ncbi:MAG: GLPGLI family protein [Bacteroidota bacterium]